MRKFTLFLMLLVAMATTAMAQVYTFSATAATELETGKYVLWGFNSSNTNGGYIGSGRTIVSTTLTAGEVVDAGYIWTLTKSDDGTFTLQNYSNSSYFVAGGHRGNAWGNMSGNVVANLQNTDLEVNGVNYFVLSQTNYTFSKDNSTNTSYIHTNTATLSWWEHYAVDGTAVKFLFYPVEELPSVAFTYNYKVGDVIVKTETLDVLIGEAFPTPAATGFTISTEAPTDKVTADAAGCVYEFDCTVTDIQDLTSGTTFTQNFTPAPSPWDADAATVNVPEKVTEFAGTNTVHVAHTAINNVTAGKYTTTFVYVGVNNTSERLNMLGVDVVNAETWEVIGSDYHEGNAGTYPSNNTYTVEIPNNGNYILRYFVYDNANNLLQKTNGTITVSKLLAEPVEYEAGYYTIKSGSSNNYIAPAASMGTAMLMTAEEAIFYLSEDGYLFSCTSGRYINNEKHAYVGYKAAYSFESYEEKILIKCNTTNYLKDNGGTLAITTDIDEATDWELTKVETPTFNLTVNESAQYSTLFLDFGATIPAGVQAYIISGTNSTHAIMQEITGVIPANTGVIIYKENGGDCVFSAPTSGGWDYVSGNMLLGSVAENEFVAAANTTYYVLANPAEGDGVGFYKFDTDGNSGNFFNAANKAYMAVTSGGSGIAYYSFQFPGTTGIEGIEAENGAVKGIYDLTGRRISAITAPGIYIIDGVKTVVK